MPNGLVTEDLLQRGLWLSETPGSLRFRVSGSGFRVLV